MTVSGLEQAQALERPIRPPAPSPLEGEEPALSLLST